ncbi:MAG: tetratricopeptide repeat protein [Alphaproteobacteria bacterium]|jgi:tetratricopeptide (TPR) repeat protein|nr:tetratricopeptide repeat protein [Alphaproteobacteria bacterium]MDP6568051.1 tetratricopeptide repeat protein [Alphaproteobacteria bacterium]MDP6815570.1 tetratricopeptide repeat protein [Alphaproteobacteria bacterium]
MKRLAILLAGLTLWSSGAWAVGGGSGPELAAARQAIENRDWTGAIGALDKVLAANGDNADAHNYLAYAHRQLGNMELAFKHYGIALRINPEHRGAHEYVGEAYLKVGNLAKAEAHLAILDELCLFGCEEYDELQEAVEKFHAEGATN